MMRKLLSRGSEGFSSFKTTIQRVDVGFFSMSHNQNYQHFNPFCRTKDALFALKLLLNLSSIFAEDDTICELSKRRAMMDLYGIEKGTEAYA